MKFHLSFDASKIFSPNVLLGRARNFLILSAWIPINQMTRIYSSIVIRMQIFAVRRFQNAIPPYLLGQLNEGGREQIEKVENNPNTTYAKRARKAK